VDLSEENGFQLVRHSALAYMGWARAHLGRVGDGIELMRQGLASNAEAGAKVGITEQLTLLAEAIALDGRLPDALSAVEDALQANSEELVFRPHTLVCRGELLQRIGQAQRAETDFREAIALAQKMSAKAWELRATMSLARLLRDTSRPEEARAMLAEIYGWFTEGFDTRDLKDAKALLDELGV
jgi:predicted ATPase